MHHFENINWLAVIVAAVLNMVIGGLWYSPVLFGNIWMKLIGFTEADKEKAAESGMAKLYIITFVLTFILAVFLAHMHCENIGEAILWSFFLWIGVVLPVTSGDYLWTKRPLKLFLINTTQYLLLFIVDSVLYTLWR